VVLFRVCAADTLYAISIDPPSAVHCCQVIGLTKAMGKEYAETGITVNAVAPAVVRTEMVAKMPATQVCFAS
jgi:short-subunit dehydrogenase